MDCANGGTTDGTNIQQYTCNGTDAQKFQLVEVGAGYSNIVSTKSGKCVDVANGSTDNNANIQILTCGAGDNQKWAIAM